jgi:hypothetical protein
MFFSFIYSITKQYRIAVINTFLRIDGDRVAFVLTDIVSLHRFKKLVSEPIASLLGKYVCLVKNVAL